jgi:hypothetical protein
MDKQELKALWEYAETLPKGSKLYEEAKQILIEKIKAGEKKD